MEEKQILTSVIEIQKENWGLTTHFSKIINQQYFRASIYRSLFFCVCWVDEYGRRDLMHAQHSEFSTRGGYFATESLRHTSCYVGSLNNSGITVKECVGHSGLTSQSANISWGMRFEECRLRLWTAVASN